jgi:DNA-binding XRE family transcriptional regulator
MATDFGKRLTQARKYAGLTQLQLGKAVGVSQSAIGEAEKIGYGSSYTYQIAMRCGVNPAWLSTGDGPMALDGLISCVPQGPAKAMLPTLSAQAHLLGECFDMLVDAAERHRAYNEATAAILAHLPSRETQPKSEHTMRDAGRKQRA